MMELDNCLSFQAAVSIISLLKFRGANTMPMAMTILVKHWETYPDFKKLSEKFFPEVQEEIKRALKALAPASAPAPAPAPAPTPAPTPAPAPALVPRVFYKSKPRWTRGGHGPNVHMPQ